jgi:CO/xanthine dehydrogenase FAD-binding subunit
VRTCRPIDDIRATAAYRRAMVQVLAQRVLTKSVEMAQGGTS